MIDSDNGAHVENAGTVIDPKHRAVSRLMAERRYAEAKVIIDALAMSETGRTWPSLADLIDRASSEHACRRLTTGFPTLDTQIAYGGIPIGRGVVTIQGPPGAGKNGIAAQLVVRWAQQGIPVGVVAGDEPTSGWIQRFAQQIGCVRRDLDRGDADAWRAAKEPILRMPISFLDPDEMEGTRVEDLAACLHANFPGEGPIVLFVDLAQTVPTLNSAGTETDKRRVDAVMSDLKRLGKHPRMLVIALSEVARGAYRSRKERTSPLASGKESGAIESRSAMLLDLTSVEGGGGAVDVYAAKTRFGRRDVAMRLAFDHERCSYTETPMPEGPLVSKPDALDVARGKVRRLLETNTTLKSATAVHNVLGGDRTANFDAMRAMLAEGTITKVAGCLRLVVADPIDTD